MLDNIRNITKQATNLAVAFYGMGIPSNNNIPDRDENGPPERDETILLLECTRCGYQFFDYENCPACKTDKLTILAESTRLGF